MRKLLPLFLLLLSSVAFAQNVVTYNFAGQPGTQVSTPATSRDPNIAASDITRGTGTTPVSATNSMNSSGWNSASQDANDYYEFTLTPNANYALQLTALNLSVQRSGTGPANYLIAYSIGGGAETTVSSGTIAASTTVVLNPAFTINTTSPVRFRLYAWGATGSSGTLRLLNTATVSGAAPLPVALSSFTAKVMNQTVQLNWVTASEYNNDYFLLERSKDLLTFEPVVRVNAKEGKALQGHTYAYTDENPYAGTSYYRLRQIDFNTNATTFPAVSVILRAEGYGVFPNPTSDGKFTLRLDEPQTAIVSLYGLDGLSLPLQKAGIEQSNLLLKAAIKPSAGVYVLSVEERGQKRQYRLIVE